MKSNRKQLNMKKY